MLPTSSAAMPLTGTPSSKADKSLRALFCGAANHLTQLYMSSLKLEKGAMKKGYCKAVEDLIKFLQLQQQYGRTISIESLVDHLKTKKREILLREDNDFGDEEDEHEEGDETPVLLGSDSNNKPHGSAPAPFGSTAAPPRSLTSQFEGLSASGGITSFTPSGQSMSSRLGPTITSGAPPAAGTAGVHFGFASAAPRTSARSPQQQSTDSGSSSSTPSTSTTAQFPSAAAASTFRDAVSIPFPLASSSASTTSNPFAPLGSSHGNSNGRKRQFFEFFFDAPPNLTLSSATSGDQSGTNNAAGGGFQFTPSHSTSTSISPAAAPSSLAPSGSAGTGGGGEGDGAMDFSCYEHQAWKRYRREEEHSNPAHRTSANTS